MVHGVVWLTVVLVEDVIGRVDGGKARATRSCRRALPPSQIATPLSE